MEVVSDDEEDRQRDLETKRQEYAQAGVAEYWIVDPKTETVTVLTLDGAAYRLHGEFSARHDSHVGAVADFCRRRDRGLRCGPWTGEFALRTFPENPVGCGRVLRDPPRTAVKWWVFAALDATLRLRQ